MLALLLAVGGMAQEKKAKKEKTYNEKGEIIKKGWNFGPLPVVGYDADLGFQYGVTCDIFNFGDGSRYPRYDYKFNVEASRYTKGSGVFRFYSDMPYVVKDTKLFFDVTYFYAKKYEFFGFNGFEASTFDPYAALKESRAATTSSTATNSALWAACKDLSLACLTYIGRRAWHTTTPKSTASTWKVMKTK